MRALPHFVKRLFTPIDMTTESADDGMLRIRRARRFRWNYSQNRWRLRAGFVVGTEVGAVEAFAL
jgi:hypothetical protein